MRLLLALLFLVASAVHAEDRFEVLGGTCRYTPVGNGVWYTESYAHTLNMTSSCAFIGMALVKPSQDRIRTGYRVGYADLGVARTDAVFPMVDAEQASHPSGANCDPATFSGCLGRGRGEQQAKGLSLGYLAEMDASGAILGAEIGAFLYQGSWSVRITSEAGGTFKPFTLDWSGVQISPYIGLTARYGYLTAMYRIYGSIRAAEHGCGGCSGVAQGKATQALIGLSVPF